MEQTKIRSLAKGISVGLWVDLEASWAFASGREPTVTCKRTWASDSGIEEIFKLGSLCVLRQLGPAVFCLSAGYNHILLLGLGLLRRDGLPRPPSLLGSPLSGLHPGYRRLTSPGTPNLLRYDERLQQTDGDVFRLNEALQGGDISQAWLVWSHAAEAALVDACRLAGGPEPERGVKLDRGAAQFSAVRLGGPKMHSARARCADPGDGAQVDLYRDSSIAPLIDLRRRLRAVLDVVCAIDRSGYSLARGLLSPVRC